MLALCNGGCAKPDTYEDCVLRYVKEGQTTSATTAILAACRKKFPVNAFDVFGPPRDEWDELIQKQKHPPKAHP